MELQEKENHIKQLNEKYEKDMQHLGNKRNTDFKRL